jgi:hypothetical protein
VFPLQQCVCLQQCLSSVACKKSADRCTKAALVQSNTGNLGAVPLLPGQTEPGGSGQCLASEVDHASRTSTQGDLSEDAPGGNGARGDCRRHLHEQLNGALWLLLLKPSSGILRLDRGFRGSSRPKAALATAHAADSLPSGNLRNCSHRPNGAGIVITLLSPASRPLPGPARELHRWA